MEELKNKKITFNAEIDLEIKILERELINKNIARRDAFREAKQQWEDDGFAGPYNPNYKPAIQGFVDAAKLDHEEVKLKKKIKKVEEKVKEILKPETESKDSIGFKVNSNTTTATEEYIPQKEIELEMIKPSEIKEDIRTAEVLQEHAIAAADHATEKIEAAILSVEDIMANHKDWIDKYEEKTGKKAIWRGVITSGFKSFIELNGLE